MATRGRHGAAVWALFVAASGIFVGEPAVAHSGELRVGGAYAVWDGQDVRVGNALIERSFGRMGDGHGTLSVADKARPANGWTGAGDYPTAPALGARWSLASVEAAAAGPGGVEVTMRLVHGGVTVLRRSRRPNGRAAPAVADAAPEGSRKLP